MLKKHVPVPCAVWAPRDTTAVVVSRAGRATAKCPPANRLDLSLGHSNPECSAVARGCLWNVNIGPLFHQSLILFLLHSCLSRHLLPRPRFDSIQPNCLFFGSGTAWLCACAILRRRACAHRWIFPHGSIPFIWGIGTVCLIKRFMEVLCMD